MRSFVIKRPDDEDVVQKADYLTHNVSYGVLVVSFWRKSHDSVPTEMLAVFSNVGSVQEVA